MIFTDRKITIRNGKSSINEPVILYRGDYEVSIKFTIMESKFRFKSGVNLVDSEKASHGQLAILAPYGGNVFSEIVKCEDGTVTFTLTKEMIDQLEEVGLYSFQIRLFDYYRESRVSIPPVEFGIEVREPVASEDHDNTVNNAIVGYSIAKVVDPSKENVGPTFDDNGQYNKTDWETGDRISEGKLNKIEDALDKINQNERIDVSDLDKRITNNYNVLQSSKMNADAKITSSQLDISNDANKIQLINLSEEVQRAMAGTAPVISSVQDKSITSNKYADGSIGFSALSDSYNMGELLSDMSLDDISKNGIYRYNGYSCTSKPPGIHGLIMHNKGYANNSVQWAYTLNTPNEVYTRTQTGATTWTEWQRIFPAKPYKTWNTVLNDTTIDGHNAVDFEHSGVYYVNRLIGGPSDMGYGTYMLQVTVHAGGHKFYYLQSVNDSDKPNYAYIGTKWYSQNFIKWDKLVLKRNNAKTGKRICLLGDSIMAQMDVSIFDNITGAITTNKAKGGSSVALRTNGTATEWDPWALCNITKKDSVNSVDIENYDIYTIWIGTNDWGHNHPIGEIDSTDEYTILGAMHASIRNIYARNPKAKILLITPTYRGGRVSTNDHGTLRELGDKIEEFANYYGIPCLNSYKSGLINEYNMNTYLQGDLLHLSTYGVEALSNRNAQFVNSNC